MVEGRSRRRSRAGKGTDQPMKLILASASPRRAQILRDAGFAFEVRPAHVNETRLQREAAAAYVSRLASSKARLIARKLQAKNENAFVIGADTVVVAGRHILGKPANAADARRMLRLLNGKKHKVLTGVSIISVPSGREFIHVEATRVQFLRITSRDIREYLATREPFDKAGAYGIQGIGGRFVRRIEGCYFNVMGLPLSRVWSMLRAAGWSDRNPLRKIKS
jgi:septum formation protein